MFLSMFILLLLQGCYNMKRNWETTSNTYTLQRSFYKKILFQEKQKVNQISLQNPVGFHAVLYKVNSTQTNGIYRQR